MTTRPTLSTIGYEGASLVDFVSALRHAGVEHVLDIRDRPISRKPGFSKRLLGETLLGAGIGYSHVQALGDPKPGRDAMRAGRVDEFRQIFMAHMERPEAVDALSRAFAIASRKPSVLLCFEADHRCCHRLVVADRMAAAGTFTVRHLQVSCTAVPRRRRVKQELSRSGSSRAVVLVKALPQVSEVYGETVCVAAVDDHGQWKRLYPITFRDLAPKQRFPREGVNR